MKITVLNGSPKGDMSVTLQYVRYLEKQSPGHSFTYCNVSQKINRIAKTSELFTEYIRAVEEADLVLWAFPLYILHVPSQYKRFIELVNERNAQKVFEGTYCGVITTSIKFYDHTAHNYMHAVCDDLKMNYIGFYSAHMQDLHSEKERKRFVTFAAHLFDTAEQGRPTRRAYPPLPAHTTGFNHADNGSPDKKSQHKPASASTPAPGPLSTDGKRVLILTDATSEDKSLMNMTDTLATLYDGNVTVENLYNIDIKGGCLGCLGCGFDYTCSYTGKDGFIDFFNDRLLEADIIIIAGTTRDRYLSWKWKQFFDRSFFNCHTPRLMGKQVGLLVSGPLSHLHNMQEIFDAWMEIQGANIFGTASDESEDTDRILKDLHSFAADSIAMAKSGYVRPKTFRGIGGMKIFRDDIWIHLRLLFQADHKAYKKMGVYKDLPHRKRVLRFIISIIVLITRIPPIRKKFSSRVVPHMVNSYQKLIEN